MFHYLILNLIKSVPHAVSEVVRSSINHLMLQTTIKKVISNQEAIENPSNLVVTTSADGFDIVQEVTSIGVVKEVNDLAVEVFQL